VTPCVNEILVLMSETVVRVAVMEVGLSVADWVARVML
jgi:hypothetical protein